MAYDQTNSGTLGVNRRKEKDTHPGYTGKLNVEGVDYYLSAWVKEGKDGKFFSLSVKPVNADAPKKAAKPVDDDLDSDIPF